MWEPNKTFVSQAGLSRFSAGHLAPLGVSLLQHFDYERQKLCQPSSQAVQAGQLRTTSPQLLCYSGWTPRHVQGGGW